MTDSNQTDEVRVQGGFARAVEALAELGERHPDYEGVEDYLPRVVRAVLEAIKIPDEAMLRVEVPHVYLGDASFNGSEITITRLDLEMWQMAIDALISEGGKGAG